MFIVLVGDPISGFVAYGPFNSPQQCADFEEGIDTSCWMLDLKTGE